MRRTVLIYVLWALTGILGRVGASEPELVARSGVRGGLIVHVGCGDGKLTAALRVNERYVVHGLTSGSASITKARAYVRSQNLYGPVSIDTFDGERLPYADNLVNLVIAGDLAGVPMPEVMRVLVPNGVAYVGGVKTVKPRPNDIDEWTHCLHDASNNAVAADRRVGSPKHMVWKAGPLWCRSHELASSISCVVSSNGRVFVVQDEGVIGQPRGVPSQWHLVARDAFNGLLLWKRPVPHGHRLKRRVVAVGDRLLAPLGHGAPVSVLDAATGEEMSRFADTEQAAEMVVCGGLAAVAMSSPKAGRRSSDLGNRIVLFDVHTGAQRWQTPIKRAQGESLAASDGRVFYHDGKAAAALAMSNGQELWRAPCKPGKHLIVTGQTVLVSSRDGLKGFDVTDGRCLWTGPRSGQDLFVAQGLVWVDTTRSPGRNVAWVTSPYSCVGLDPRTGKQVRSIAVENLLSPGHHPRCYRAKATERYILQRKRGIEFIDLSGENHQRHDWLRAPCRHGFVPANGLIYMPPHQCFCYPGARLNGFYALAGGRSEERGARSEGARLLRGPAYRDNAQSAIHNPHSEDWPTFRHDPRRSGSVATEIPAKLQQLWSAELGMAITPPVVTSGRLYVAAKEAHAIHCLNAETGRRLWDYTAGGRIDSPPTAYGDLALFGCTDGNVHCLRSKDGALVWRFLAAPSRRRIMAFGQLESPWPVHGSVLVQDGLVYATAGRSSYLDGGIYAYALRPETGEIVHSTVITSPEPDLSSDPGRPFDMDGTRTDVLVSDGTDIYLFRERLTPDLKRVKATRLTRLGDHECGLRLMCTDGMLDESWFNRSFWTYSRHWPGFYFSFRASKSGQILVFNDKIVCALKAFTKRRGHSPEHAIGSGYQLVADRVDNEPFLTPHAIGRDKSEGFTRSAPPLWSCSVRTRAVAMVLAGQRLCLAGPPDMAPDDDPLAAFEGRLGAHLRIFSTTDGVQQAEYKLAHVPVSDGMIAANGRLYISTRRGHVLCMGRPQ